VKEAEKRLKDGKDYFNLLLAMTAMGLATANADGEVCDAEIDEINEFVAGIGHEQLPAHVKGQITRLCNNPPTFNTAMHFVEKVDQKSWPLFAEVIKVVSNADGRVDKREEALLKAWQRCANDKSN
jgi:tellurite resistance protein